MTTASTLHARDLDGFVAECDKRGGPNHPDCAEYLRVFDVVLDTKVNQDLDPFSDEYVAQMVSVSEELAGRTLNQGRGNMPPLDVAAHAAAVSPYNTHDVRFLSKHNRAVTTALMLANLPAGAEVLDAGCGWGLSSEAMAFSGARVTALDIDPLFVDLVRRRAARLGLPIEAVQADPDEFQTDKRFDLLFFSECLHRSVRPWKTLAHLSQFVKPEGKVVFAWEQARPTPWRHWGVRLDAVSVYCARKFGWRGGSWTGDFLGRCFAKAGFSLTTYRNVGLDGGSVGFAPRAEAGRAAAPDLSAWNRVLDTLTDPPPTAAPVGPSPSDVLKLQLEESRSELKRLAVQVAEHQAEVGRLRHALESMQASRSWRATAPVRSLLKTFGGSRVGGAG